MYKKILVPIDLSEAAKGKAVIETARALADKGGELILLNVVEELPGYVAAELPSGIMEKTSEHARTVLQDIARDSGPNVKVEVRSGNPNHAILTAAEDLGVDVIVIASHKPGFSDYFLGSTAARVVRHAKCHVLVVR